MSDLLVLYYFQGEPGESLLTPNAFVVPRYQESTISFGRIMDAFPSKNPNDQLHFRCKMEDKLCGYIWKDLVGPNEQIPVIRGMVTLKILRLNDRVVVKRKSFLRKKKLTENMTQGVSASVMAQTTRSVSSGATPVRQQNQSQRQQHHDDDEGEESEEDEEEDDGEEHSDDQHHQNKQQQKPAQSNKAPARPVAQQPQQQAPLPRQPVTPKSPHTPVVTSPPAPPVVVADFLDFDSPTPKTNTSKGSAVPVKNNNSNASSSRANDIDIDDGNSQQKGDENLSREELIARREAATAAKVQEAKAFNQELTENSKRDAEEFEAARLKYDKTLDAWAANNKEKRNIRTLLSTMHTVLWPGNTWKAISLGDVIDPNRVKFQYRKAMLVVHPDRCSGMSQEIHFIAKRVFEAINEAYQEFLKKEGL